MHANIHSNEYTANDLKPMHMLWRNSPKIQVVCGQLAAATMEVPRAGASAIWSALTNCVVFVQAANTVVISAWSKEKCIGAHTMECKYILDCTPDQHGNREAYLHLCDEKGKTTGKLKISFLIESVASYTAPPLPFDTSAIRIGLEPPILVTVRTISLINIRSVHKYGNNSPLVKASCGEWRGATPSQDYAGKNAKWRDLMWGIVVHENTNLVLVVQSGTIVIGTRSITPEDFLSQNPNNQGLCEFTGQLIDSKGRTFEAGQIRVTYNYEPHIDPAEEVDSDSDEDDYGEYGNMDNGVLIQTGSTTSKSIGTVHLLSAHLQNLFTVNMLRPNSPFFKVRCDDYRAVTSVSSSV